MKPKTRTLLGASVAFLLIVAVNAEAQDDHKEKWTGRLEDGTVLTKDSLDQILNKHKQWRLGHGKQGQGPTC
jgi:hypothetical protein